MFASRHLDDGADGRGVVAEVGDLQGDDDRRSGVERLEGIGEVRQIGEQADIGRRVPRGRCRRRRRSSTCGTTIPSGSAYSSPVAPVSGSMAKYVSSTTVPVTVDGDAQHDVLVGVALHPSGRVVRHRHVEPEPVGLVVGAERDVGGGGVDAVGDVQDGEVVEAADEPGAVVGDRRRLVAVERRRPVVELDAVADRGARQVLDRRPSSSVPSTVRPVASPVTVGLGVDERRQLRLRRCLGRRCSRRRGSRPSRWGSGPSTRRPGRTGRPTAGSRSTGPRTTEPGRPSPCGPPRRSTLAARRRPGRTRRAPRCRSSAARVPRSVM